MSLINNIWCRLFSVQTKSASFLSELLGYRPADIRLYEQALTHKSNNSKSNERLEYLGDAVISLVVADRLYHIYPGESEGFLTRARAKAVCRENLNHIARQLGLDKHLHTGSPIKQNTENIYGNALEALVGAIYLDKGFETAAEFTRRYIIGEKDYLIQKLATREVDFKSRLLEYSQARKQKVEFVLLDEKYEHSKDQHTFLYEVQLEGKSVAQAAGHSKLEAQQTAARKALKILLQ